MATMLHEKCRKSNYKAIQAISDVPALTCTKPFKITLVRRLWQIIGWRFLKFLRARDSSPSAPQVAEKVMEHIRMQIQRMVALCALLILLPCSFTHAAENMKTAEGKDAFHRQINATDIASIEFGHAMRQIAYRISNAYWAANGGNWRLAQYQIDSLAKEMDLAKLKVRQRSKMLGKFQQVHGSAISTAIASKDLDHFNPVIAETIDGCNECHAAHQHEYIRFQIPQSGNPGSFLDFTTKTDPQ